MKDQSPSTRVDLWVFRDGKQSTPTVHLVAGLVATMRRLQNFPEDRSAILDALIRAGEIESAFSDAGLALAAQVAKITDALATHLVQGSAQVANYVELVSGLREAELPQTILVSPPEGFSYYGL